MNNVMHRRRKAGAQRICHLSSNSASFSSSDGQWQMTNYQDSPSPCLDANKRRYVSVLMKSIAKFCVPLRYLRAGWLEKQSSRAARQPHENGKNENATLYHFCPASLLFLGRPIGLASNRKWVAASFASSNAALQSDLRLPPNLRVSKGKPH